MPRARAKPSPHEEVCRVSAALVSDLLANSAATELCLRGALTEVESEIQQATASAWGRAAAVHQRVRAEAELGLGMQDERAVDELPALRTAEVERLCRRVVTAERRAAAVAVQRDALREQFLLVQQQCSELLAENAQVHGVNAALNGMLGILRDAASVPSSAAEAEVLLMDAGREAEGERLGAGCARWEGSEL